MDAARLLLNQLMGEDRDMEEEERLKNKRKITDKDVDKFYLVAGDHSPYVVLAGTKSENMLDAGNLIQDPALKEEWDALPQEEKDKYGFEYEMMQYLQTLVEQMDRKIKRQKDTIEVDEDAPPLPPEVKTKLEELNDQIKELNTKAELAGEEGNVDESMASFNKAEELKQQKQELERAAVPKMMKKQFVCEVSGLVYSSTDNETRIRDLQQGKHYQAWKTIREKLAELKLRKPPKAHSSGGGGHDDSRGRDRDRGDRERADRDRDRERRDRDYRDRDHRDYRDRDYRDRDYRDRDYRDRDYRDRDYQDRDYRDRDYRDRDRDYRDYRDRDYRDRDYRDRRDRDRDYY